MVKRGEESDKILVHKDPRNLGCAVGEAGCSVQGWMAHIVQHLPVFSNKVFSLPLSFPDLLTDPMF